MSGVDTRNISRDSLFLMAQLRVEEASDEYRVRVRNLSAGGMMAEGHFAVERGANVSIELRNIGKVDGVVAWVQDGRCGIAFAREIEPKLARASLEATGPTAPHFTRPAVRFSDPERVRNL